MNLVLISCLVLAALLLTECPSESKEGIQASEVLLRIERGLPIINLTIEGDLDLHKLNNPNNEISKDHKIVINQQIKISDCKINENIFSDKILFYKPFTFKNNEVEGNAGFNNSTFNDTASFDNSVFSKQALFNESIFNKDASFNNAEFIISSDYSHACFLGRSEFKNCSFNDANFENSHFNKPSLFDYSEFTVNSNFKESEFNETASFEYTKFHEKVSFLYSAFNGADTNFKDSIFNEGADFTYSAFKGPVFFENSSFNGEAGMDMAFQKSTFSGNADFENTTINSTADFRASKFYGIPSFHCSRFNGIARFDHCLFNDISEFDGVRFNGTTSFNSSQFKKNAFFLGSDFNCTTYFSLMEYDKLYIRWRNLRNLFFDDYTYISLIRNFKILGYYEDADDCYYSFREEQFKHKSEWDLQALIDLLARDLYGYGVKPFYTLKYSAISVIIFGLIYNFIWWWGGLNRHNNAKQMTILDNFGSYTMRSNTMRKSKSQNQERCWICERLKRVGKGCKVCWMPKCPQCYRIWREFSGISTKGHYIYVQGKYAVSTIINVMIFSLLVFLSGTKLFIDPPDNPRMHGFCGSLANIFFIVERILGAFFFILLFLAISTTVVRQIG